jgi:hypothetical protein
MCGNLPLPPRYNKYADDFAEQAAATTPMGTAKDFARVGKFPGDDSCATNRFSYANKAKGC